MRHIRLARMRLRERIVGLPGIQQQRRSQYDELPVQPGDVLLLGDSMTEGGAWAEWLRPHPVRGRGISGDTVAGLAARLDPLLNEPSAVALLIGTNDVTAGLSDAEILAGVDAIVERIRDRAPQARLVVQSLAPRTAALRDRLTVLNDGYRRIAQDRDAVYLDLWPGLATADGVLRAECTNDSLHLLGPGYRAWAQALRPVLLAE